MTTTQIALIEATPVVAVEAAAPVATKPKRTRKAPTPVVTVADKPAEPKAKAAPKAKPAAKTESKPKAAAKPKAKAAAKAAAPAPVLAFKITTGGKPSAGARLFAYTQAVHDLTGMSKGAKVGRAKLRAIVGDTAIAYHLKQGNYALTDDSMVFLTELGQATFALRAGKILDSDYAAFVDILTTGKANDLCKNPIFIEAV